jgi:hypothetical protein
MRFSNNLDFSILPFIIRRFFLAASLVLLIANANAQCITETQLIYATDCSIDELRSYLYSNNWSNYYFNDSGQIELDEMVIPVKELTWSKYDQKIKVLILHKDPSLRIIAYYPSVSCFSNIYRDIPEESLRTTNLNSSETLTYNRKTVEIKLNTDFRNNTRSILAYQKQDVDTFIRNEQLIIATLKKQAEERKELIKGFIGTAKSYVLNQELAKALRHLNSNEGFLEIDSIQILYTHILNDFNSQIEYEFQNLADLEKFEEAIAYGSTSLASDYILPTTRVKLTKEMKSLEETMEFLKSRETQVYSLERYGIKQELEKNIERELQNFVRSSPDGGKLSVQVDWKSNYLGENISEVYVNDPALASAIKTELLKQDLPKIGKYFVNSKAIFKYNVEWDSRLVSCNNGKSIQFSRTYGKEESYIRNWIQSKGKGRYTFNVLRTKINDREIFKVVFEKYVNTNIAPSVAKGYILPGAGKPSLTKGRYNQSPEDTYVRNLFWLSTLTALTCEGLSQLAYQSYLTNPTDITAYETANSFHQYSLISAGAAVVCYVAGIREAGKEAKDQREQEKSFNKANKNVTIYQDKWSF